MGFPYGSAVGGFAEGIGGGVDIASKLAALRQQQHEIMARQAMGRTLAAGPPQVSPMPGAPSMPSHSAQSPDPMMGNGPPATSGMVPDGAPPLPQAASPMATAPAAAPAPGPTGAGGDALSGAAASSGDPVKDAQATIMNIAQQIKAANPQISPEELFNATNLHIEQMKGVRNDVKDYMVQQIELAKVQARIQTSENRLRGVEDTAQLNYQGRTEAASIRGEAQRDVAGTQAGARVKAAGIGAGARVEAAGIGAGARTTAAQTAADAQRDVAGTRAGATVAAAREGRAGRENAAGFATGASKPKLVGYDPQGNPIYVNQGGKSASSAPGSPAPAATYKSAADVKAAFQAGKLSQKQATTILQQKFGYQ